jgi:hypothetical protein
LTHGTPAIEHRYGFTWGPLDVVRHAITPSHYVLSIATGSHELHVYVSRAGRKIRVWLDGKELK